MEILATVERILGYGPLCDHCLGRFFGKRSFGLSNDARGNALRISHALEQHIPFGGEPGECWICGRLFDGIDLWASRVIASLEGIEYETFLIGSRIPPLMAESEELVWSDLSLSSPEPIKAEVNREVGKEVSRRCGKEVDFHRPDVVVILDIGTGTTEVQVTPLFLYGRYCKYVRTIPQTRWYCRVCRGKGCERCHYTGKMYADSVEELIGAPLKEHFGAEDAILHGAGREDINARMLGTGRPFVMEVVSPHRRSADLSTLTRRVSESAGGAISVRFYHWSSRQEVEIIKSHKGHKKYRISVEVDGDCTIEDIQNATRDLSGATIAQRTPERVSHRRADLTRMRKVISMESLGEEDGLFLIEVVGQAGLYIKELVSGDDGRTTPSLTGVLGAPSRVVDLDVVMVEAPVGESEAAGGNACLQG
ncbi:MAG: tRNA pseudouridine(54/55) synthase Pus10 [Methanomicrobiaceae archaeon]|nr:tRNA pseudouridine(54/55) synthase Pus10 [Methanomicrobiaceae archaeon]